MSIGDITPQSCKTKQFCIFLPFQIQLTVNALINAPDVILIFCGRGLFVVDSDWVFNKNIPDIQAFFILNLTQINYLNEENSDKRPDLTEERRSLETGRLITFVLHFNLHALKQL